MTGSKSAIIDLSVEKNIRNSSPGEFVMHLVPGGPKGINSTPVWQDILTPQSLVVIGMQRFSHQQIVMVGLVKSVRDATSWRPGQGVSRSVEVRGEDFQSLFIQQNYYLQLYLAFTTQNALGSYAFLANAGIGLNYVTPDQLGSQWFSIVMAGKQGILSQLSFAYQSTRLTFYDLMSTYFQPFDAPIDIPVSDNFYSSEGNWFDKFSQIFPFPWYEMFISTAPLGYYGAIPGQRAGYPVTMAALPGAEAVAPVLAARVNPLPFTPDNASGNTPIQMDTKAWDALPGFSLDNYGYIQSEVYTSEGEVRNFYIMNPVAITNLWGNNNAQVVPFQYQHGAWIDPASIHRYGLKPQIAEFHWLNDPEGINAKALQSAGDSSLVWESLIAELALRQTSYFEPTPLMRRAQVTMELRPDILPGTKFTYAPYKDGKPWVFYIEGVSHNYAFAGLSTTSLSLSRGLPESVYENSDVLLAIHTGEAQILDGQFVRGLPAIGNGLQPVNGASILNGVMGQVAGIFNQAQPASP